jgi:hypothetical protein
MTLVAMGNAERNLVQATTQHTIKQLVKKE